MCAKSLSNRNISNTINEIIDKILPNIKEFHNKSFDKMYAIVFIDEIRFKTREDDSKEVLVYIVMGVNMQKFMNILSFRMAN